MNLPTISASRAVIDKPRETSTKTTRKINKRERERGLKKKVMLLVN